MKQSAFRLGCVALAALAFTVVACRGEANNSKLDGLPVRNTGQYATIETDKGNIVVELYPAVAPKTVANFEKLSKDGFYNNLTFHRVEPGFVIQGGDPSGNGTGGPGYEIPAEISPTEKHLRGTIAMARTGDNVNPERKSSGSQFYICLESGAVPRRPIHALRRSGRRDGRSRQNQSRRPHQENCAERLELAKIGLLIYGTQWKRPPGDGGLLHR